MSVRVRQGLAVLAGIAVVIGGHEVIFRLAYALWPLPPGPKFGTVVFVPAAEGPSP